MAIPKSLFEPKSGRRGTKIKGEKKQKQRKAAKVDAKQETPCVHLECVKVCEPVTLSFLSSYYAKRRERKKEKKRDRKNKFPTPKRNAPKYPEQTNTLWGGGSRVVGGVVASSSS